MKDYRLSEVKKIHDAQVTCDGCLFFIEKKTTRGNPRGQCLLGRLEELEINEDEKDGEEE